jgi:hypothetical protein
VTDLDVSVAEICPHFVARELSAMFFACSGGRGMRRTTMLWEVLRGFRKRLGPGDSYVGMWRMLNRYRHKLSIVEGLPDEVPIGGPESAALEKRDRYL